MKSNTQAADQMSRSSRAAAAVRGALVGAHAHDRPTFTIYAKALLLFAAALLLLFSTLYFLTRSVILAQFQETEIHQVRLELERIRRYVEMETAHLQAIASDWAAWPAVQTFVRDADGSFPPAGLFARAMENLRVDFMAVWDAEGRLLAFRTAGGVAVTPGFGRELLDTIESDTTFGMNLPAVPRGGVIASGRQLAVLGFAPLPAAESGGPGGSILTGRLLTTERLQQLQPVGAGNVAFLPLVAALDNPELRGDVTTLLASGGPLVRPLDDRIIWGAILLRDLGEHPLTGLVIEQGRELFAAGQRTVRIFLLAMTAAGGALILLLWLVLDLNLLRRIARLDRGVRKLKSRGEIPPELSGGWRDELGTLASSITDLTSSLQEAEAGYRRLFETSQDGTLVLGADRLLIREANPSFCRMLGMQPKDLVGRPLAGVIPVFPAARLEQRTAAGAAFHQEELLLRKNDGTGFFVEIVGVPFEGAEGRQLQLSFRDITERKRSEQTLRELSGRLLRLQDEERRRIARELHDSTAQNLSALEINFTLLGRWAETSDEKIRTLVDQSRVIAASCSREIRTLSYLLHPPLLDEVGLLFAIRWFTEGYTTRTGIEVRLELPEEFPRLASDIETALFRVVQECLTNVYRHSGSKEAWVRLACDGGSVLVEIGDRGSGFVPQPEKREPHVGLGLPGMRERIRQQGGDFEISSGNSGTVVRASIPYKKTQLTLPL